MKGEPEDPSFVSQYKALLLLELECQSSHHANISVGTGVLSKPPSERQGRASRFAAAPPRPLRPKSAAEPLPPLRILDLDSGVGCGAYLGDATESLVTTVELGE